MKVSFILPALVAIAAADYSCPSARPALVCDCRLWEGDYQVETNNIGLCDYQFGQTDCASHRTRNYCCAYVEVSGFDGRFNGVDCTGAKNFNYLNHEWNTYSSKDHEGDYLSADKGEDEDEGEVEDEDATVQMQVSKIMQQAVLRDSRPGREIVSWEIVT